jgi:hypothetical protein
VFVYRSTPPTPASTGARAGEVAALEFRCGVGKGKTMTAAEPIRRGRMLLDRLCLRFGGLWWLLEGLDGRAAGQKITRWIGSKWNGSCIYHACHFSSLLASERCSFLCWGPPPPDGIECGRTNLLAT